MGEHVHRQVRERKVMALILENVTVVDPRTGKLMSGVAVVMNGDRIDRVVPQSELPAGGSDQRVDGTGKFVVPGFQDMHAHTLQDQHPADAFAMMLAY